MRVNCINRRQFLAAGAAALSLPGCYRREPHSRKPVPAARPRFTDITRAAGLDIIQSDGSCGMNYFVEQVAAGAALFDANGDGFLDIYFPQPVPLGKCKEGCRKFPRHRLFLNDGKGNFTLSPNAFGGVETDYGIGAAVGDYNNDGHPDLYVCCYGKNKLFRNRGDGTFEDVTEKAGVAMGGFSTGAVWFDYDGDGFLDLYVLRYCEWTVETNIDCPGPHHEPGVCNPSTYQPSTHVLFHNNGDGTFTDATRKAGMAPDRGRGLGVAAADFKGLGRLDLFVANDLGPNFYYHNQGDGSFEEQAMQQSVAFGLNGQSQANMGVAVGDCDGDGDLDIVVSTFSNEPCTLYRNDGAFFTDSSYASGIARATLPYLAFGAGFIDCRNEGTLDLFFAEGHVNPYISREDTKLTYPQRNQLLLNNGAGEFVEAPGALPSADVRVHRGACFGDIDNDGRIDILVTAKNDRPTLLHNDSPPANWLLLKLTNRHGCCTPVGVRCIATVNGKRMLRAVLGGGSYGGSSDYRVHFGLGGATHVERLEIHWLYGKPQILTNIPANQILAVRET
ncbi:MAG TPA: CRTAC1 family protein [Armatimonadota bacterium]|nr:CRTAC1 family protein [Armatimonadota bacterium]